MLPPNILISSR